MRNSDLFSIFMVTAALSLAACRGADYAFRDPGYAGYAEDAEDAEAPRTNDRMCPPPASRTSGALDLDWMDIPMQSAAPLGKSCCVSCGGDYMYGRFNLGKADNCDARAKTFCEDNRGRLLTVEWDFC